MSEKKMTCIAIDDEPFALKLIADDIAKVPFLALKGTFLFAHGCIVGVATTAC
ncbi:MAG: hypothetical protein WDO15_23135 [Bacteroidota bacterium]